MPMEYQTGMIGEHLATRKDAGLFDVSHMGRFVFGGPGCVKFLQHVLTNNAEALEPGESQYTLIADQEGGAIDDAYLYRFEEDEYLLVVNASNREIDWDHLEFRKEKFSGVTMADKTEEIAMFSLQGPKSKAILAGIVGETALPEPMRNYLSIAEFNGTRLPVGRTGYTGEPLCFELFVQGDQGRRPVGRPDGKRRATGGAGRSGHPPAGGRACPCTATNWATTSTAKKFPCSPPRWPGSRSASLP